MLSFGLTNAAATFQAAMNSIFRPDLGKFVLVYLDDILVFSKSPEEHTEHLETVLRLLREHTLFSKRSKSQFTTAELDFLGDVVVADGIRLILRKGQLCAAGLTLKIFTSCIHSYAWPTIADALCKHTQT